MMQSEEEKDPSTAPPLAPPSAAMATFVTFNQDTT